MENRDKSVSPEISSNTNNENLLSEVFTNPDNRGLTKREYCAALAMQGMLANPSLTNIAEADLCETAVICADELLKKLEN